MKINSNAAIKQSLVYQPIPFFFLTYFFTSTALLIATYISYQPSLEYLLFPLIFIGISGPTIAAFIMFAQSKDGRLWNDFLQRWRLDRINLRFIPIILFLMPCVVFIGITLSLLFGFSSDQFSLSQSVPDQVLEGKSFLSIFLVILLSCTLEEIGWRGYGVDSLNSKFNLWVTSLIFATFWCLWHVPAFFIHNGYFQQEVWNLGWVYIVNYFASIFPLAILINWAYIKNNRSILIAIFFHAWANLSIGLFPIQPFTKIIIMLILWVVAALVVIKDKELFFAPKHKNA
jgi:membrane protease YdiL (CAAX protease family)